MSILEYGYGDFLNFTKDTMGLTDKTTAILSKLKSIETLKRLCIDADCHIDVQNDISILSEPVQAGVLCIPNSFAIHPMEGADGNTDGTPSPLTFRRYQRFAAGGAGLIWVEAIAVVPEGRSNSHQLWIHKENKKAFSELIYLIRRTANDSIGSKHRPVMVAQLTHSGRYSRPKDCPEPMILQSDPYRDALCPMPVPAANYASALPPDKTVLVDDEYLDNLQWKYIEAAKLAFDAGFDAVDIKACHGYLISELLSSRCRQGKYGTTFENRSRFLLEVIDKIHQNLGADCPISCRLGFYDAIPYPYGWGVSHDDFSKADLDEPKKLMGLLVQRGVRLFNFTIGNPYLNPHLGRPFNRSATDGYISPEHPLKGVERMITLAGELQKCYPDAVFVGTGYSWLGPMMGYAGAAAKALGKSKMIGVGRMAFAYPDFAKDLLNKGTLEENKVCIACSGCSQLLRRGLPTGCIIRDSSFYGKEKKSKSPTS
ncbi:MAG TPA: hypothetical protein PK052_00375 [Anaerohalosphaeraceae bacterium]|nr:flavin oxidoreductase/NADH oxidase [Phycisphaerae bacterium]HOL30410.1 hypothetical protein [Anaerohalosphaeraceae bacterium]HPC65548.1 hypothetical protein [Anaerohalosphaeraceae bacterium]HPO69668.1 hypothetical protein [Anaerohalosphaeraceae bacterium]